MNQIDLLNQFKNIVLDFGQDSYKLGQNDNGDYQMKCN